MKKFLVDAFAYVGIDYNEFGAGIFIIFGLIAFVGVVAQLMLYSKCKQPAWACLVPIYNGVVFMRILGRPGWHILLPLIPIANIYFVSKMFIELCQCFGQFKTYQYVLCILFNGLYVLNLGFSEADYMGPVYGKKKQSELEPQLA